MHESEKWKRSRSIVSDSKQLNELQPTRLLRPWDLVESFTMDFNKEIRNLTFREQEIKLLMFALSTLKEYQIKIKLLIEIRFWLGAQLY